MSLRDDYDKHMREAVNALTTLVREEIYPTDGDKVSVVIGEKDAEKYIYQFKMNELGIWYLWRVSGVHKEADVVMAEYEFGGFRERSYEEKKTQLELEKDSAEVDLLNAKAEYYRRKVD